MLACDAVGMKVPSSLRNMIKELKSDDVDFEPTMSSKPNGHLANWAKQGASFNRSALCVECGALLVCAWY